VSILLDVLFFPLQCVYSRVLSVVDLQEGWTALMAASRRGHLDIVEQLLVHGANPNMQDYVSFLHNEAACVCGQRHV